MELKWIDWHKNGENPSRNGVWPNFQSSNYFLIELLVEILQK
jgi:hypothetical protein